MKNQARWVLLLVWTLLPGPWIDAADTGIALGTPRIEIEDRVSGWREVLPDSDHGESAQGEIAWRRGGTGDSQKEYTTELDNQSDRLRCMAVSYAFPFTGSDLEAFFTGIDSDPAWPEEGKLAYAYVRETADWTRLSVPSACLVSRGTDTGVSFAPELSDMPILPFEVTMERRGDDVDVVIRRPLVRLEPRGKAVVKLFAATHAGDKRAGLAWMRDKWPGVFTVRGGLEKFQYGMFTGCHIKDEETFQKALAESHLHRGILETRPRPWFGLTLMREEPDFFYLDQKWYFLKEMTDLPGHPGKEAGFDEIIAFFEALEGQPDVIDEIKTRLAGRSGPGIAGARAWWTLNRADVSATGKRIKEAGFKWLYYWNPSECWAPWATRSYPKSLYVPLSRDFLFDSTVLDPFAGSARARDLVAEVERLFDQHPECDGLFMDQVYYDLDNPEHDDGISITSDGKPFSRHQWNTYFVIKEMRRLADERGKVLMPNFLFNSLEIASLSDFGLVENVDPTQGVGRFYDIGNRLHIVQVPEERASQYAALWGWQTNLFRMPGTTMDDRLGRFWLSRLMRPIMVAFQGRTCVLEPHCIAVPPGFEGSVFRQPNGNYVATIVAPGASHASGYAWGQVPVRITLREADRIKRVYLLSSDRLGPAALGFSRAGDDLSVTLPRHRAISALVLARTGRFVALEDTGIAKDAKTATLVRDDVDAGTRTAFTHAVTPGHAGLATFEIEGEEGLLLPRSDIEVDGKPTFEVYVEDDPGVTIAPPVESVVGVHFKGAPLLNPGNVVLNVGEEAVFTAAVHPHSSDARAFRAAVSGKGVTVTPPELSGELPQAGGLRFEITARGKDAGRASIAVGDAHIDFEVIGSSLAGADVSQAKEAALIVDSIASLASCAVRQKILLNGVEAGILEQRHGAPGWDVGARHVLSEAALKALKERNVIEVEMGDDTKLTVKNVALEIVLDDGTRRMLRADPRAQSTDWLQAAGRRVEGGSKMRWDVPAAARPMNGREGS